VYLRSLAFQEKPIFFMQEDHSYKKGRGAQFNPSNRFLAQQYEPDEGEQIESRPDTQFFTESPKSILSKVDSPDLPMMYSVNPYRGCEHGCIYCYARNSHEFWGFSAGLDFETKITVKPDAPALLEKEFRKKYPFPFRATPTATNLPNAVTGLPGNCWPCA
jgi:hypothetical protein